MKTRANRQMPLVVLVAMASLLSGCISPTLRTEPPAPVYERGTRVSGEGGQLPIGETAGIDTPELSSGAAAYEPEVLDVQPAAAPTQAPAPERIAMVDPGSSSLSTTTPPPVVSAPPVASSGKMSAAAKTLLAKAESEQVQGNLTAAASTLERALRIENHALLWNRLANVRLQQQRYSLASDLASKSNAIAGSDAALKRNNWLLIAQAKQASGDTAGAATARQRANALR